MHTLDNECVRRGEGLHIRVLSTDSNQQTLIFSNRNDAGVVHGSIYPTLPDPKPLNPYPYSRM